MKEKFKLVQLIVGSRIHITLVLLSFALLVVSNAHADEKLVWMGCGISKKAYMGKMAKEYEQKTGVQFRMAGGGATKGIRLTASGKADVGGSCRYILLTPNGTPQVTENVEMVHVAWDALAVIVNKDNPVENLTFSQLKDIFSGKIKNWRHVGGPDKPIRLLVRNGRISGVGRLFRQLVLNDEIHSFDESAAFFASSGPLERNLENRKSLKYGIAITGISSAKKTELKVLKIDNEVPGTSEIAEGRYPLFRPLYLVLNKKAKRVAKDFVNFVLSDEGQAIIASQGTVSLSQGKKLEQMWKDKNFPL